MIIAGWSHQISLAGEGGAQPFAFAGEKGHPVKSGPTVLALAADLAARRSTSRALVEQALAAIADPTGEGARVFLEVDADRARVAADAQDGLRQAGYVLSPLAGLPVSIKDLFDIAGQGTRAGSTVLNDRPLAASERMSKAPPGRARASIP